MKSHVELLNSSSLLPKEWDVLAENYFQQSPFLTHLEKYNPCKQRYYLVYSAKILEAGAIVYTLNLDLLTFLGIRSPLKMHIVGIPCSVSCPGIFGSEKHIVELKKHIADTEKGLLLFLNLVNIPQKPLFASGKTLPTIMVQNNFNTWDHYLSSLRSDYRRRLKLILQNKDVSVEELDFALFTEEMHAQYLDVFKKSKAKLEKLNFEFFKNLGNPFKLQVCNYQNKIIGWNITLLDKQHFYFFLGGVDYAYNTKYSTYLILLSTIIKQGIESGTRYIDLGQTAEIPKMRMGGKLQDRYMEAHHQRKIFNYILKAGKVFLEYRRNLPVVNVFKKQE